MAGFTQKVRIFLNLSPFFLTFSRFFTTFSLPILPNPYNPNHQPPFFTQKHTPKNPISPSIFDFFSAFSATKKYLQKVAGSV